MLGIPHHTGYPLYTLVGWVWAHLIPIGSVAYRMNLLSALLGAASVGLATALTARLSGSTWAALAAGTALMVAPLHWQWATIAGVRSGAAAEVAWMLVAAVGVLAAGANRRSLAWLGLAVGVALAHHRSGVLVLPGIALALASLPAFWRAGARAWLPAAGMLALPLLTYAYLPIRGAIGAPFHQWRPETLDGFVDLVFAIEHSRVHFIFPLSEMPGRAGMLLQHLRGEFGLVGLGLAALGALWLFLRWPRAGIVLAAFWLLQSWQVLNWDVGVDRLNVVYELPADVVVAVWLGVGTAALLRRAPRLLTPLVVVCLLAWSGWRGYGGLATQNALALRPINHDREELAYGWQARRIVGGGLDRVEPNAVVVGDWEQATAVWYLQLVEGIEPDVQVTYTVASLPFTLRDYPARPVWLMARPHEPPPAERKLSADGPFVRVGRADEWRRDPPSDTVHTSAAFENAIELVGFGFGDRVGRRRLEVDQSGDVLPVTLYWKALEASRPDLSVSLRLIGPDGAIAAQQDNAHPVLSLYPTSRWSAGEVVGDYYELPYRALEPGDYRLELRVYHVSNGGFRDLRVGNSDHVTVTIVRR